MIKTKKEYHKELQALIDRIKRHAIPFPNDTLEKRETRKSQCLNNFFLFCKTYFPHYFTKPFGKFHHKLIKIAQKQQCISAIAGPRAHGKTVILSITYPIWLALKEQIHFPVFISENKDISKSKVDAMRAEFAYNARIINDFGKQIRFGSWEDYDFTIITGARFLAQGYRQMIKGLLHGPYRPDYVIFDDLEGHLSIDSERISKKKIDYIRGDSFGALSKKGRIIWLGNLTHSTSALARFKTFCDENPKNQQVHFYLFKAENKKSKLLWPEGFTKKDLQKIKNAMGTINYEKHYQMNPIIEGDIFKDIWFQYIQFQVSNFKYQKIITYIDPSLASGKTADYKAIITLGWDGNFYDVLDCFIRKCSIETMIEHCYNLYFQFHPIIYGMEDNFWQSILFLDFDRAAKKKGFHLPMRGITNTIKKEMRIESLSPLFERDKIRFATNSQDIKLLKEQLLGFPGYPYDDGPDALQGAIQMIEIHSQKQEYHSIKKRMKW